MYEDSVIESDTILKNANLVVKSNLIIENYGTVETDVFVDSADLFIKNLGDFKSNFYLKNNANVYHVLSGGDKFNFIDFNVDYGLIIKKFSQEQKIVDLSDYMIAANNVYVDNAILNFSGADLKKLETINLSLNVCWY